jgi:hypothetical protein
MPPVAQTSSISPDALSFIDHFIGKNVTLSLDSDGYPLSPEEQRKQIISSLELVRAASWILAQRLPETFLGTGNTQRGQEPPPPLTCMSTQYSPFVPAHVMIGCVATICRRLATAPVNMRVAYKTMRCCAELVIGRVGRGRASKVQAGFQRANFSRDVIDVLCSELWLIFGCVD